MNCVELKNASFLLENIKFRKISEFSTNNFEKTLIFSNCGLQKTFDPTIDAEKFSRLQLLANQTSSDSDGEDILPVHVEVHR